MADLDHKIDELLRRLGRFLDKDRAYLFTFSPDGRFMRNTHEWCAPGVRSMMADLREIARWVKLSGTAEEAEAPADHPDRRADRPPEGPIDERPAPESVAADGPEPAWVPPAVSKRV